MENKNRKDIVRGSKAGIKKYILFGSGALLVCAAVAAFIILGPRQPSSAPAAAAVQRSIGQYAVAEASAGIVRLPLAGISDGNAHYFTYESEEGWINFFVMQSSDGVMRAAFDACDVCYESKLGYRQQGDNMVCNNCGRSFPSTRINVVQGGCNPSPLAREIDGDSLVIRSADILAGSRYF